MPEFRGLDPQCKGVFESQDSLQHLLRRHTQPIDVEVIDAACFKHASTCMLFQL